MAGTEQPGNYMINDLATRKEEFFPGEVVSLREEEGQRYFFTCENDAALMVHVITDKVLRFRFSTTGRFDDDFSYAIDKDISEPLEFFEFKEKDDHYRFTTERIICTIGKKHLETRILDRSGTILCDDEKGFHWENNREHGGEIVLMSKKISSGEHFYGLGDKPHTLDLRGKRVQNWGSDTYGYDDRTDPIYKNIPFYIGLHNKVSYGVFFDNSFRTFFDFGSERSNVSSFWAQGGEMNYYFFYGPDIKEVCEQYTDLTGKPELPPMWALGYHQCKWSYYPEKVVRDICSGFREREIPCDAIYLDIDYMDGFRCFTWDPEKFPDPKKMVSELAADGFKTIVIIDPGIKIDKEYSVYNEAIENDYFCHRMDGPLMKGSVWPGLCNFPDYTKPDVRVWWAGLFKGLIEEVGVKGVWNDMNEPAVFEDGTFPIDVRHDYDGHPCSHRKAHNVYGMQMARATYEGVKRFAAPNRPFTITRSGYSGMQRFASVWTGDNVANWNHLKIANRQAQRLSISGVSFAGSDIGGFIETPDGELYTRWIQLGIFHPFCRTHSSGDHGEQEPWSFGEPYTSLVKRFIELRYQILPYLYTTFWQYTHRGTPMLRPLTYLAQRESESYAKEDEFGLGDNLLISPITEPAAEGRWMYLPEGAWYYFWDDGCHNGSQEVWADAKLDRVPLFIRAGGVVPFYPIMQYVGEKKVEELTLHVYPPVLDEPVYSELYEDAGDGYGYEQGDSCVRTFTVEKAEKGFSLTQDAAGGYEPTYQNFRVIVHGLPAKIKVATIDGQVAPALKRVTDAENRTIVELIVPRGFRQISFSEA